MTKHSSPTAPAAAPSGAREGLAASADRYPAPRYRRLAGVDRNRLLFGLLFAFLAILVLAPVIPTIYQSLLDRPLYSDGGIFSLDGYHRLFTDGDFGTVALNTLAFASLTTVFSLAIAVPMAIVVTRTNVPGRRAFGTALQWPFFVSSLILGFGWMLVYGPAGFISVAIRNALGNLPWDLYTIPGMALTEAAALAPIAYLFCSNALRRADASIENAAQTVGAGPLRILWSVVIPLLRPPVVYSALLVFSISVETLSIPLIFGQPAGITVFSTFLYNNGLQAIDPDYGMLGAGSTIILVVTIGLVALQAKLLKNSQRFVSVRGKATRPRLLELGWLRWIAFTGLFIYTVFGAIVPLLAVVLRSFTLVLSPLQSPLESLTLNNYQVIFQFPAYSSSIVNSLLVAGIGAVIVVLFALLAAVVARRSTFRGRRVLEYVALAPQAMPGLIVGIGLFWAFAVLPFGLNVWIQGSLVAIIIGFSYRALPTAFGSIAPAIMQIAEELDQAARVTGADWIKTVVRFLGRLLLPAIGAALILTFITMFKEYSPAIFLGSANTKVIGTTMLELWAQGVTGAAAGLATIQIAITAVVVAVAGRLMKGNQNA